MRNFRGYLSVLFAFLSLESAVFAQGSTIFSPMSKYVFEKDEVVQFQVHNQLSDPSTLSAEIKCDVDGLELKADECAKFFRLKVGEEINPVKFEIPKQGSLSGEVSLIGTVKKYALLKPVFAPVNNKPKVADGVAFEFSYQPGYLYIVNPDKVELPAPKFSTQVTSTEKVAVFDFDLSGLNMPAVASISAKVMDKKDRKMLRFVRLASDKIIDPRRKTLSLQAGYASPKDETPTCFEFIIQWAATKNLQKLTTCN